MTALQCVIDIKEATKRGIYVTCTGDILTEATADLTFALMLAISINTTRGQIIDEIYLIQALRQGWISGAGLDVFEEEPPSSNNPLLKMNNVVLLPHIGSATFLTRTKMAVVAAKNLLNVLNQKNQFILQIQK